MIQRPVLLPLEFTSESLNHGLVVFVFALETCFLFIEYLLPVFVIDTAHFVLISLEGILCQFVKGSSLVAENGRVSILRVQSQV